MHSRDVFLDEKAEEKHQPNQLFFGYGVSCPVRKKKEGQKGQTFGETETYLKKLDSAKP